MKRFLCFFVFFLLFNNLSAQPDSTFNINKITRSANIITVGYYWTAPHTLKNSNATIVDGIDLNNNQGYYISGILPIYVPKKGHFRFMANYGYLSTTFENSSTEINDTIIHEFDDKRYVTHRYTISPTVIVNYKLKNKTVVNTLKLNLNSYDFFNPSYYSVLFTTAIILKRTPEKNSMIGMAIIHSNETPWPVIPFPIYTYNTFINPKWTFELTFPYSIGIRRIQNENFTIKSDIKLDILSSMFRPQYYNEVARFSDIGMVASVNSEYKLLKYIVWKFNAQYKYSFGPKIKDVNTGEDIYKFGPNSKFMINTGLSFSL